MSCELKEKIERLLHKLIKSNEKFRADVLQKPNTLSSAVILETVKDMLELQAKDISLELQLKRVLETEKCYKIHSKIVLINYQFI